MARRLRVSLRSVSIALNSGALAGWRDACQRVQCVACRDRAGPSRSKRSVSACTAAVVAHRAERVHRLPGDRRLGIVQHGDHRVADRRIDGRLGAQAP